MKTDLRKVAEIAGSELKGNSSIEIKELLIDSRKIPKFPDGTLFIALNGEKNDGHNYIPDMYESGVRAFMVTKGCFREAYEKFPGAGFVVTEDSLAALQKIAAWKRGNFKGKVISVTGSNGKTIIKEWLSDILGKHESLYRSPGSYNSQVGVPLSVWGLENNYSTAIIEAGMSRPGEISRLEKIIKPEIGIFTHIGEAHQENFDSISRKVCEKLELFRDSQVIIYPSDEKEIHDNIIRDEHLSCKRLFTWSRYNEKADVIIDHDPGNEKGRLLNIGFGDLRFSCIIPFIDRASLDNMSTVITTLLYLGLDPESIADGIRNLEPVAMRMEQKEGINNCLLLEDIYNSDPGSLKIALDHIKGISDKRLTLILSDFIQSSRNLEQLYKQVAEIIRKAGVNRLIAVGPGISRYSDFFKLADKKFYAGTEDFINSFSSDDFSNEAILLKGARMFGFERIGRLLELKTHQTQLVINLNKVLTNLNTFRTYLDRNTRIMAMVKAFAYGAGPMEISEWLAYNGVDFLAVAYPDEGFSLRKNGINKRIMVMNPDRYAFGQMIEYDLEPEIYSPDILNHFITEAKKYGLNDYPVHIKIDTGMHRLGFMEQDIDQMAAVLNTTAQVGIASVFSHLAAAYDPAFDEFTHEQVRTFTRICDRIGKLTGSSFLRHILNSAGIIRFPEYRFDMVRLGIGLHGVSEVETDGLMPASSFYTHISQVKRIGKGEGISYGLMDVSDEERKIAILPIGYADGLRRSMGAGRGRVYADGHFLPITGNICMDMCMIDISGTDLKAGDKVEIFGDNISIKEIAEICGTIPYEILTGIPARVKRIFLYE